MESEEDTIAAFMQATGCGYEEAFERLASCGGHLGRATSLFLNVDAGPSGTRPSPPPSPSQQVSDEDDDHGARRKSPPSGSDSASATASRRRRRVSRWDVETTRVDRSSSKSRHRNSDADGREPSRSRSRRRRRFREHVSSNSEEEDEEEAEGGRNRRNSCRHVLPRDEKFDYLKDLEELDTPPRAGPAINSRRRRIREHISSDSEEEEGEAEGGRNHRNSRRRVLPPDEEFDYLKDLEELDLDGPPPPPPQPRAGPAIKNSKASTAAERHELAHRGGFHDAKVRAARERRWLLVNVRGSYDLASFQQTRAVWDADVVARCVRDQFVLWQADAHAGGGDGEEAEEAKKVLCYYGLPHDWIPTVVVVDPVTGQALEKLHGSDACVLNDFLLRVGPYTDTQPAIPVRATKNSSVPPAAGGVQSNRAPAEATTSPAHSSNHVEHASSATKPSVAAPTGQQPPAPPSSVVGNKACKLRVRLPDGRAVTKEFGGQCAVAELFEYCQSELRAGAAAEKPFRLARLVVGGAREEIGNQNASFESLRLHLATVFVDLG